MGETNCSQDINIAQHHLDNFSNMISSVKFFCAALFGVICGAVTVLCLNAALKAKEGEEEERQPGEREEKKFSMQNPKIIPKNMVRDFARK